MFCIGKRVTLSTVNPIYMNRSHKFCDNNLITWKVYWNIISPIIRIFASVTYHEKSEVFVLVPCYCYYSWKRNDISTLYLNFNITMFAEFRQISILKFINLKHTDRTINAVS